MVLQSVYTGINTLVDSYVRTYEESLTGPDTSETVTLDRTLAATPYNPQNPFNAEMYGLSGSSSRGPAVDGENSVIEKKARDVAVKEDAKGSWGRDKKRAVAEHACVDNREHVSYLVDSVRGNEREGEHPPSYSSASSSGRSLGWDRKGVAIGAVQGEQLDAIDTAEEERDMSRSRARAAASIDTNAGFLGRLFAFAFGNRYKPMEEEEQGGTASTESSISIRRRNSSNSGHQEHANMISEELQSEGRVGQALFNEGQAEETLASNTNRVSMHSLPPPYTAQDASRSRPGAVADSGRSMGWASNVAQSRAARGVEEPSPIVNEELFREQDIYGRIDDYFKEEVEDCFEAYCEVQQSARPLREQQGMVSEENDIYATVQRGVIRNALPSYEVSEAQDMLLKLTIMEKIYLAFYEEPNVKPLQGIDYHQVLITGALMDLVAHKRIDIFKQFSLVGGKWRESERYQATDHMRVAGACSAENSKKRKGKGKLFFRKAERTNSSKLSEKTVGDNVPILRILSAKPTGVSLLDKILNALVTVQADQASLRSLYTKFQNLPIERAVRRNLWKRGMNGIGPVVRDGTEIEDSKLGTQIHHAVIAMMLDVVFLSNTVTMAMENLPFDPAIHPFTLGEVNCNKKLGLPLFDLLASIYKKKLEELSISTPSSSNNTLLAEKEQMEFLISSIFFSSLYFTGCDMRNQFPNCKSRVLDYVFRDRRFGVLKERCAVDPTAPYRLLVEATGEVESLLRLSSFQISGNSKAGSYLCRELSNILRFPSLLKQ
eukprot:Nk52_evm28s262 gene=Nk52_evmTU28s262